MNISRTREFRRILEHAAVDGLTAFLDKLRFKKVALYGAGYCGRFVLKVLLSNGIIPEYFLDQRADEGQQIFEIPVHSPLSNSIGSADKSGIVVLLCVICNRVVRNRIARDILALGYQNVVFCEEIYFNFSRIFDPLSTALDAQFFSERKQEIVDCIDLFSDHLSVNTYMNNVSAYVNRDFDAMQTAVLEQQYFPSDISLSGGYSCFVDCGAYTGDTISQLLEIKGVPDRLFAFEPDLENFSSLSKYVREKDLGDAVLYPCGVSCKTRLERFNIVGSTQGTISEKGEGIIQCVSLDDVLIGVGPSFIKMDIEGAEYDALIGAQRTIGDYRPDLAICVYHDITHYFKIPHLISGWGLGYRFWLRTHDKCGTETVLYASCER